jgi:acetyltransferase-like isoleucine patch superfamily enzyme
MLKKQIVKVNLFFICLIFKIRRKLLGFENANAYFRRLDKCSTIPILKQNGAKIGNNCEIEAPLYFHNCIDFKNLNVGNNCHIGKCCFFDLKDKVEINDNCTISMQTTFITHTDLGYSIQKTNIDSSKGPILINSNVYIGARSTILHGITIGEGSVIGACSLVLANVDSNSMAAGVPAKVKKQFR